MFYIICWPMKWHLHIHVNKFKRKRSYNKDWGFSIKEDWRVGFCLKRHSLYQFSTPFHSRHFALNEHWKKGTWKINSLRNVAMGTKLYFKSGTNKTYVSFLVLDVIWLRGRSQPRCLYEMVSFEILDCFFSIGN